MNQQKVVVVTGASSGIGRSTAQLLARSGYTVVAGARNPSSFAPINGVRCFELDVTQEPSVSSFVRTVLEEFGRIDVLVNNAGYTLEGSVEETSIEEGQAIFDTNVFGVLRMIKAVLPSMRDRKSGQIINMSSVLGFLPAPYLGLYASTKHAVEGMSESLDHEVREFGIRVTMIEPSFVNTHLAKNTLQANERLAAYSSQRQRTVQAVVKKIETATSPELIADEIKKAIESKYKMRRPAGGEATLLSRLRRFMPAGPVDKSLRKVFALEP